MSKCYECEHYCDSRGGYCRIGEECLGDGCGFVPNGILENQPRCTRMSSGYSCMLLGGKCRGYRNCSEYDPEPWDPWKERRTKNEHD